MPLKFKAVVFDAFGTLFKCFNCHQQVIDEMLSLLGKPYLSREFHREWDDETDEIISDLINKGGFIDFYRVNVLALKRTMDKHGLIVQDQFIEKYSFKALKVFEEKSKPFQEVKSTLKNLKNKGVKLAVLSNARHEELVNCLEKWSLDKYFSQELIVSSDKAEGYKPSQKVFTYILGQLGTREEETIMVGDSMYADIQGAKEAGLKTVYVERGNGGLVSTRNRAVSVKPDFTVRNLNELLILFLGEE